MPDQPAAARRRATATEADRLRDALALFRRRFPLLTAFGLVTNLLFFASPLYLMQIYDRVLSSGRVETLVMLTLITVVAVLFSTALESLRGAIVSRIAAWLERTLAADLFAASLRAATQGQRGAIQPLRELATLRTFVGGPAVIALADLPFVPLFLVAGWVLHPWLGMLGTVAAVLLLALMVLNEAASRRPLTEATRLNNANVLKAEAAIRNAHVFQAMGMLPAFLAVWRQKQEEGLDRQTRGGLINSLLVSLTRAVRLLIQVGVTGLGAYLVLAGELTGGGLLAASLILGRALAPIEQMIGAWKGLIAARDSYNRLVRFLDAVPLEPAMMPLPAPRGDLACERVTLVSQNRVEPILNEVSFRLDAGTSLGIIGPSASGKSTLCGLLVGIARPTSGHVRLDRMDVYEWRADLLGPHVGYLPQDVELFEGPVKSLIARLDPDPDPQAVVDAARTAGVHDLILELPKGYETEIGEGQVPLSGGQRQRLGLARAFYGRPRLIVLDEPNANLDGEGEQALHRGLEAAKGWGATVVIVAQQLSILKSVDRLMLMRAGRVELFGPRQDVLTRMRVVRFPEPAAGSNAAAGASPALQAAAPLAAPAAAPAALPAADS